MKTAVGGRSGAIVVAALVLISSLAVLVSVPRVSASKTVTATATASQSEKNQVSPFTSPSGLYPDTAYLNKISTSLKDKIMQDPEQMVKVTVYSTDPVALGRTLRAMGVDTPVGKAPSKSTGLRPVIVDMPAIIAAKIAYLDSVGGISLFVVPQPLEILNPESENGREESPDGANEPGVNTIRAAQGHHVTDAWARGFTGSDVRVAILDSGVDFANPDLLGTWAIEENTSSPYYLWPIAFDPFSMYVYLYFGGASYPAAPSWYVDTSFNATADVNGLLPLFNDRNYNVTGIPSASGWYHLGVHPAPTLAARFGSHSPGVLLTDSAVPFVYDTIYVDLNDDDNFLNDKPVDIFSPVSYADYRDASTGGYDESSWDWGDGMPDVSGGLIYFIANGVNPIPYSDVVADRYGLINMIPGNGNLTAFMIGDAYAAGGDHGTMCSSAVVAQNVTGRVQGFAPDARIVAVGDIYFGGFWTDIYPFAAEGYDGVPGTGDEAMVSSSSYGTSNVDNDGWDYESRFIDLLTSYYDGTTYVASTGNGGYGFGTVTPPGGGKSVISVGASTSYYSGAKTSWENGPMWTFGDVQPWSNRGPSSLGNVDPDVVTVGAWASGDNAINTVSAGQSNGTNSWSIWGGTSLSSPATAGIVALIYDAYEQGASVYPTNTMVKEFLMNGADNINYDPLVMGAGLTNAERSTMLANGLYGVRASPSSWTPGGYRGTDYPSFAHVMSAGDTTWKDFQLTNRGGSAQQWSISDAVLRKAGERTFDIWSNNSDESSPSSNRPDYLWNVSAMLSAYPNTKFVRGIAYTDFASFDPEYDYTMNSAYRALFYDWKDLNGNGLYWDDLNGNGVVNSGELDNVGGQVEYMRFTYAYGFSNVQNAFVHDPLTRVDDALLFGVIHRYRDPAIPSTRVHVVLEFYELADSAWITEDKATVTLGAGATQTLRVTVSVPPTAAVGVYSAMVILKDTGSNETVIPIVINVAGNSQDITFQEDTSNTSYYDNGRMYGGQDWSWRPEAGDWRFYFMDVPDSTPITDGTRFLIHTKWNNYPTDIDTLLFGPTPDDFSNAMPSLFGPYALSQVGGSPNMNIGAGTWLFNTATGGPEEWVSGPAANGLHEIALHNVLYAGEGPSEVFSGATGFVNVNPFPWTEQLSQSSGVKTFDFMSTMDMPDGMEVRAYGVSEPTTYVYPITQDERVSFLVDSVHAGLMDIVLSSSFPVDLDLYVYYELPGGGEVPVGSSTSPTANERVKLTMPDDGTYKIEVHGFTVPMPDARFDLTIDLRAGMDLNPANVPSGPIVANAPYTFDIDYDIPDVEGDYYGVIFIGPMGAPTTIELPVLLMARDTTPPTITLNSPSAGIDYRTSDVQIIDVSFDDVRGAFYSGVDMNSILLTLDGRDVTSSARIVAGELWWNLTFLLSEGQHTVDIQMYDLATTPNLASLMFTFGVDNSAPIIVLTSPAVSITNQPAVNVVGYTESTIATVLINGVPTATTNGAFSSSTNLVEGPNTIQIEATDLVGNTALLHKDIELDTQPPALTVTSPTTGSYIKERTVVVAGTTERGASVVIEGINAAVSNVGDFAVTIALKEGGNSIRVVATDPASNAHVEIIGVTVDTVSPAVTITSPTGAYTNNPALTVSGQTEPSATVAVNSAPVAVAGDGSFTTTVGLGSDGGKNIWVNATDVAGNTAAVLKTITLDTVAPTLAIAMPTPMYQTTVPSVEVRGTTEPSATITVNGQMAMVDSTGGFDTIVALLVDGVNTIYITATDQAGNTNQQTRDVTYIAPDIAGLQNQITLLLGMINDLNNQIDNLDNQIADMNDTINQQSQDITNVNNQLTTIQGRLDALNQTSGDIRTLKSDLDGLGNVLMMGMVLLIVMLFVGLIGMYFAISRKIRALQGPQEDLGEIEEEEELQPEKQQPKQMPKEEKRVEKKVEIEEAETEEEDEI